MKCRVLHLKGKSGWSDNVKEMSIRTDQVINIVTETTQTTIFFHNISGCLCIAVVHPMKIKNILDFEHIVFVDRRVTK